MFRKTWTARLFPRPRSRCGSVAWRQGDDVPHHAYLARMSLFPDLPPPATPPAKPKLTAEERRARQADRLTTIRLRMAIRRELDERGITTPAEIGVALGMSAAEATKLLQGRQWRADGVALLKAAAVRLGLQMQG